MHFSIDEAPMELQVAIREFWPEAEWDNAAGIARLESNWDPFAVRDTRDPSHPCGSVVSHLGGVAISAELSIGEYQINACNFPGWEWQRFYNVRHNAGTAHLLWIRAGELWTPWYFSSRTLGLVA